MMPCTSFNLTTSLFDSKMTRKSGTSAIWLLSAKTLELHEFDSSRPPYATLSCSWSAGSISLEDLIERDITSRKSSFPKLQAACCQARDFDLHWIWNDDVCIDRRSTMAISECSNSIGDIYWECSLCMVHLQDFPAGVITEEERGSYLENCSWIRSAWTLPHLILPQESFFYDTNWVQIGQKSTLAGLRSNLLGIDTGVLDDRTTLAEYSVAKRMSWASGLWAPRIEDKAYSLLSIFGIRMSIQYGQGRRAFLRLQTEILKSTKDSSLFAWKPLEFQKYHGVLARSPAEFQHFRYGPRQVFQMDGQFRLAHDGLAIETTTIDVGHRMHLPLYCENSQICSIEILHQEGRFVRGSLSTPRPGTCGERLGFNFHSIWVKFDLSLPYLVHSYNKGKTQLNACSNSQLIPDDTDQALITLKNDPSHGGFTEANDVRCGTLQALDEYNDTRRIENQLQGVHMLSDQPFGHGGSSADVSKLSHTSDTEAIVLASEMGSTESIPYQMQDNKSTVDQSKFRKTEDQFLETPGRMQHQAVEDITDELVETLVNRVSTLGGQHLKRPRLRTSHKRRKRAKFCLAEHSIHPRDASEIESDQEEPDANFKPSFLACPFYIRNQESNVDCLTQHELQSIEDIKQHLCRVHRQPIFCPVCGDIYISFASRDHHLRGQTCTLAAYPSFSGITDYQLNQLGMLSHSPSDEGKQWFDIWNIVFPGIPQPHSPFYSGRQERLVCNIRRMWRIKGHQMISEALRKRNPMDYKTRSEDKDLVRLHIEVLDRAIHRMRTV